MIRLMMVAVVGVVMVANAQDLSGPAQSVMDVIVNVLRQLMVVAVDFIRMVLHEVVVALQELLPSFLGSK
ncbi:MAG: hypothetical protein WAZ18_06635 [Alphaproteobacteria bacterium]